MSSSTPMMIRLHPVSGTEISNIGGTEFLRLGCTERPDLDLPYNTKKVNQIPPSIISLGKNSFTMIADPTLPRNAVDVVVELCDDEATGPSNDDTEGMGTLGDTIRLLVDPITFSFQQSPSSSKDSQETSRNRPKLRLRIHRYIVGFVAINNETVSTPNAIINEGDILSLQSMSYSYDYVVMMTPTSDSTTSNANAASNNVPLSLSPSDDDVSLPPPADSTTNQHYMELVDQQQKLMQQMVNDEFTCAICLEYQVQSTALVPCGHSFVLRIVPCSVLNLLVGGSVHVMMTMFRCLILLVSCFVQIETAPSNESSYQLYDLVLPMLFWYCKRYKF